MPTKYQPLVDYVAAQTEKALTLTFAQIEEMVGSPLSETMQVDASQWTSARLAYVRAWEATGWRARLDRRNRRVHFTRDEVGDG